MRRASMVLVAGWSSAMSGCSCSGDGGARVTEPTVTPATTGGDYFRPFDSVPDPPAGRIYFTASDERGAGVFSVPLEGGAAAALHTGDPYVAPFGIDLSSDGATLFVADSAAGADDDTSHVYGVIYAQPTSAAAPAA